MRGKIIASKELEKAAMYSFLSVLIFSFIAHGFMFFNKISFHDDIGQLFHLGGTFVFGRWFLGVIGKIWSTLFENISVPWWNGLVSSVWIAQAAFFCTCILKIRKIGNAILIGALMAVFPVVASTYAFMFTAPHYFFALFLCVLAVFLQERGIVGFFLGVCCLITSLGIYQAYFAVVLTLLLLLFYLKGTQEKAEWNYIIKLCSRYVTFLFLGIAGYLIINELFLWLLKIELSTYQGFNGLYQWNINRIGSQIIETYRDFFKTDYEGIHPTLWMQAAVWVSFFVDIVLAGYLILIRKRKKLNKINIITTFITFLLFPFIGNAIYFISYHENTYIHHIMRYSLVFVWMLPIVIMEQCCRTKMNGQCENVGQHLFQKIFKGLKLLITVVITVQIILYCYLDNAAYLKAYFVQEQSIQYFSTLATTIKLTPGYKDEYPVAFLQERQKSESTLAIMDEFKIVQLVGYDKSMLEMINDYNWEIYMERYCGYNPQKADNIEEIENWPEVKKMPCYPDDGSIAIIGNTIIVKFAEKSE